MVSHWEVAAAGLRQEWAARPPNPPVRAGMEGECPLLGGSLGSVHCYGHLLGGTLTGVLHHQGIAAWPQYGHLQLGIHLGEAGGQRAQLVSCPALGAKPGCQRQQMAGALRMNAGQRLAPEPQAEPHGHPAPGLGHAHHCPRRRPGAGARDSAAPGCRAAAGCCHGHTGPPHQWPRESRPAGDGHIGGSCGGDTAAVSSRPGGQPRLFPHCPRQALTSPRSSGQGRGPGRPPSPAAAAGRPRSRRWAAELRSPGGEGGWVARPVAEAKAPPTPSWAPASPRAPLQPPRAGTRSQGAAQTAPRSLSGAR